MKVLSIALVLFAAAPLSADVKSQEKTQVQFTGMMGRMMGLFGGKAAREGVIDSVAVRGNRKMTINDQTGRIVDLDEEKVYELDMKGKSYRVRTFDDLRREMEQAQQRAKNEQEKSQPPEAKAQPQTDPNAKKMQIDFDLKESGQKKNINGFDCREVVLTITVHEKGKTLEQSGGMVMTTHEWLGPRIAAMREIEDFDRRYAEKLHGPSFAAMPSADQMAAAAAMYPMMTDAFGKFNAENVNMDGTAILTSTTMESVASPEQQQQQQQASAQKSDDSNTTNVPTSVGGLLGGLGRRAVRNKAQQQQQQQNSGTPGRATIMTMNHEVVSVTPGVNGSDVAVPAGFKEKK